MDSGAQQPYATPQHCILVLLLLPPPPFSSLLFFLPSPCLRTPLFQLSPSSHTHTHTHRAGEAASVGLTEALQQLGFETDRLKTGTPARIDSRTVDFGALEPQPGDEDVSGGGRRQAGRRGRGGREEGHAVGQAGSLLEWGGRTACRKVWKVVEPACPRKPLPLPRTSTRCPFLPVPPFLTVLPIPTCPSPFNLFLPTTGMPPPLPRPLLPPLAPPTIPPHPPAGALVQL